MESLTFNWDCLHVTHIPAGCLLVAIIAIGVYLSLYLACGVFAIGAQQHLPSSALAAPGAVPLLGHLLVVIKHEPHLLDYAHEVTLGLAQKTWYWSLPFMPVYINVVSPSNVEHILRTRFDNYEKGVHWRSRLACLLGGGIFNADGEAWRQQRKTASHMFNVKSFRLYFEQVFADAMPVLLSRLQRAADCGAPIDMQDLMYQFMLDSFSKIGFSIDAGCLTSAELPPFARAFDRVQCILNKRFFTLCYPVHELLTGARRQLRRDLQVLDQFSYSIIRSRRAERLAECRAAEAAAAEALAHGGAMASGAASNGATANGMPPAAAAAGDVVPLPPRGGDLLSLFLDQVDGEGRPLSDAALRDHVLNFIIAGRDTTAVALSWALLMLAQHPEAAERMLMEVDAVMEGAPPDASPTYDQVRQMPWAKAVLMETLRLHPSIPKDAKQARCDDTLPDGTFVPAGAMVLFHPYIMGRLESLWGPDAALFRPQRWLDRAHAPSPYEFPVFNAGPRICLGQRMAELEGVFVLVGVLRRYSLALVPCQDLSYASSMTLPLRNGVRFTVRPRCAAPAPARAAMVNGVGAAVTAPGHC